MQKRFLVSFITIAIVGLLAEQAFAQSIATTVIVSIVPDAPSNLTATPTGPTQVELDWTNNAMVADGVSIERKTGTGGTYAVIATTTPDIATYIDNSASPATTYFYRVNTYLGSAYSAYSDEASVTTPSGGNNGGGGNSGGGGSSGGGGGGGGGIYIPPPPSSPNTSVVISGSAYPLSKVIVLQDGQVAVQTIAGPDANFSVTLNGLTGGNYSFSVYGEDSSGRRSTTFTFPVTISSGVTTLISGVFLSPTIDVDKQEVKQGDTITIFGESVPNSHISIEVDSAQPVFASASSNQSGAYLYEFDTAPLALGSHIAKSKAASGTMISDYSISKGFIVGDQNIAAQPESTGSLKGDLNGDGRVNLIDFSILAYWYGKSGAPAAYLLDGQPIVDLADFSIMAYYWTG